MDVFRGCSGMPACFYSWPIRGFVDGGMSRPGHEFVGWSLVMADSPTYIVENLSVFNDTK